MSFLPNSEAEEEGRIVERHVLPAPVPQHLEAQQEKATRAWHIQLWQWLRGYTGEDINRLKEAGVRRVEADADAKAAEARQKISEAERNFAERERIKQEALLKQAEAAKAIAEANKTNAEAMKIRMEAIVNAVEQLSAAASRIRQNGGDVFLDKDQLKRLISDASKDASLSQLLELGKNDKE